MAVSYDIQADAFHAGSPREVASGGELRGRFQRPFDVAPDGQSFVMLTPANEDLNATQLVLVQNWLEELKRLVPTNN